MNKKPASSPEPARPLRLAVAIGVVLVLILGIWLMTTDTAPETSAESAPDVTLEFFDGDTQRLSDFVGKPVVLNFWASWYPACISEMPFFADVHRRLGGQVEFIGVNMQEVDLEAAAELVEQTTVEYRLVHDLDGAIFTEFGGIAMPTTVFITADGSVARVHAGTIFADELTSIIESDLLG